MTRLVGAAHHEEISPINAIISKPITPKLCPTHTIRPPLDPASQAWICSATPSHALLCHVQGPSSNQTLGSLFDSRTLVLRSQTMKPVHLAFCYPPLTSSCDGRRIESHLRNLVAFSIRGETLLFPCPPASTLTRNKAMRLVQVAPKYMLAENNVV